MELEDNEFKQGLDDIHNFRLGVIRNLTKTDIEEIQMTGFRFRTKTIAGRREELKQFILEHPSLMSQDAESIKYKFKILSKVLRGKQQKGKVHTVEDEEEEDFEEEEEQPKKKPKKTQKRKVKAITMTRPKVVISSTDESEVEEG